MLTHFSSALQGTDQPGSSPSTSLTLGSILDALALVQKADAHKAATPPPPGGSPACRAADAGKAAGAGAGAGGQLAQPGAGQAQHGQGLRPPSLACTSVPDQQPPPAGAAGTAGGTIQVGAGATAAASAAAAAANTFGSSALGAAPTAAANGAMGLDLAGLLAESGTPRPSYPSASSLANSPSSVAAAVAKVLGLCTPPSSSSPTPWLLSPRAPQSQLPTSFPPPSTTFPAPTTSSDSAPPKADHSRAAASPHLDLSLLPTLHLDLSSSTQHKAPLPLFNTTRCHGALSHPTRVDWSDPSLLTAPPAAHGACPASLPNTQAAGWSIGGGGGGGGSGGGDATAHSSKRSSRTRSRTLDTCHSPGLTLSPAPGSARGLGSPDLLACLTLNLDPAGSRHSPGFQAGHSAPSTFDARSPSWGGGGLLGSPSTPGQGLSLGLHGTQKELGLGAGAGQAGGLVGVGCDFRRLSPVLNLCSDPPANVSKGLGHSQGQWGSTWSLPDAQPTSNQGLDSPAQQQLPSSYRHQDGCMASQPSSPNLAGLHLQPASTSHRASPLLSLRSQTSQQDTVPRLMLSAPSGDAGQGELDRASTGNTASRPAALSLLNSLALQPHPGSATFSPASMPGGEAGGVGLGHAWPPPLLTNPGGSSTPPTRHGSLSGSQGMRLWASSQGTSGTGPMASEGSSSGASQPGLGGLGGVAGGAGGTGGGAVAGGQFGASGALEGGSLLPPKPRKPRDPAMISKVQQCAGAIMRMVGTRTIYERQIRETLGNNPDTSKALRLLMTQGKLARVGAGGRGDPFAYKATASRLDALQEMIINTSLAV
ncbi:hypothetical protein QJQ45_019398 [Haematococcus lacustris]|nr:hypothetical protein QJQ45_019398 [Haematococcus lacustris]